MKKLFLILAVLFSATVFLSAADDFIIIRMVRHGQPGVGGTLFTPEMKSSWIRLGLTPLGIRQAQITGEYLKKEGRNYTVIASPQERASETADIICGILGKTFTLDKDLREVGNPIKETLPELRKRFRNIDPKENMALSAEQAKGFKESTAQMGVRGKNLIAKLIKSGNKGPYLLVSHGGFMNATAIALTGKRSTPWNCGMLEFKVSKDGKGTLVKAAYPEVFTTDLITDNQTTFAKDPWYGKFAPHKGKRPDNIEVISKEFQLLLENGNSMWRKSRGLSARCKDKTFTLKCTKKEGSVTSPLYPVAIAGKYMIILKAKGKGTGSMRVRGAPDPDKVKLLLSEKEQEFTLKISPHKKYRTNQIIITADKGTELTLTSFKILPVK